MFCRALSLIKPPIQSPYQCVVNYVTETMKYGRRQPRPRKNWVSAKRLKTVEENITPSNEVFLKEVVRDKYAPFIQSAASINERNPTENVAQSVLKATPTEASRSPLAAPVFQTEASPLKDDPWPKAKWTPESKRTGVIARKIGVYPLWLKSGKRILSTLLQIQDNHVIRYHPPELVQQSWQYQRVKRRDSTAARYGCLVVGANSSDPRQYTASYCGLFKESGVMPKERLTKFLITPDAALKPGTPLSALHYRPGDYIDIWGITIEHGFQGVMKRWGMKGGPGSHGNTKQHRRIGSLGGGRTMGRVWPGKKMPGLMGLRKITHCGIKILRINTKYNILYVHGPAVPGPVHSYVYIYDSKIVGRELKTAPPFPTFFPEDASDPLADDLYDSSVHSFDSPTIEFESVEAPLSPQQQQKLKKRAKTGKK